MRVSGRGTAAGGDNERDSEMDGEDEATENYLQSGGFRENSRSSTTVKHILDDVQLLKTTTTERLVPTLTIEEVLPTKTISQISDEEELAVTEIIYKGKKYLKAGDDTIYDIESHEEIGRWDGEKVILD